MLKQLVDLNKMLQEDRMLLKKVYLLILEMKKEFDKYMKTTMKS